MLASRLVDINIFEAERERKVRLTFFLFSIVLNDRRLLLFGDLCYGLKYLVPLYLLLAKIIHALKMILMYIILISPVFI